MANLYKVLYPIQLYKPLPKACLDLLSASTVLEVHHGTSIWHFTFHSHCVHSVPLTIKSMTMQEVMTDDACFANHVIKCQPL